jgi:hypothetical protein
MSIPTTTVRITAGGPQLWPLISLRWAMVRSARTRRRLFVAATVPLLLCVAAVAVGRLLPRTGDVSQLLLIVPALLLGFLLLSIVTPLAAGGGNELYPQDQLVAFPIRSRTTAFAALVLAPLNLAWLLQVLISLGLVSYASRSSTTATVAAAATILSYVLMVTALGQTIGWVIVGVRQTDAGRYGSWAVLALLVGGFLAIVKSGALSSLVDRSPTLWVLGAALKPSYGDYFHWFARTSLLLGATALFVVLSARTCSWALRQPDRRRGRAAKATAARASSRTRSAQSGLSRPLSSAVMRRRIDRAGVWRSQSLRRGVLILSLFPASALLIAGSEPSLVVLLPGLVAAGSGLLFAVNAFCLDGSGALWLASLPGQTAEWFWSRTRIVAEVAGLSVVPLVLVGLLRLSSPPSLTLVLAVLAGATSATAWVTALCLRASVTRPHRALLLGPRDTPAPPGAMAMHSIRLSAATTGIGLLFTVAALTEQWWCPLSVGVGLLVLAARSLIVTARTWSDPLARSRVVATVSAG